MRQIDNNTDNMTNDLTGVYKKYKGKWVATDDAFKKVIASGSTSSYVYQKAKKLGFSIPNIFRVPSDLDAYIG